MYSTKHRAATSQNPDDLNLHAGMRMFVAFLRTLRDEIVSTDLVRILTSELTT